MVQSSSRSGPERRDEIRLTREVHASVERVWRALSDPRGLARWQADDVFGEVAEGGALTLSWPAHEVSMKLDVLEVVARERIVFGAGPARVALELREGRVDLAHWGLGEGDALEGIASSWRVSLALLAHSCERHPDRDWRLRWSCSRAGHTRPP